MGRKKLNTLLGGICMGCILAVLPFMVASAAPIKIKAITSEKRGSETVFFELYMKNVNEEADGKLIISYVGGPEAIPKKDQPEALRNSVVQLGVTDSGALISLVPEANFVRFSRLRPVEERKAGLYNALGSIFNNAGFHFFGRNSWGASMTIWTNKKIQRPQELSGQMLRVGRNTRPFAKALGCGLVNIPPSEIYSSMNRGLIDGFILPATSVKDSRLFEVVKYAIKPAFWIKANFIIMNMDTWNSLPKNLQDLMTSVFRELEPQIEEIFNEDNNAAWQTLTKNGIEIIELSPADADWFINLANEVGMAATVKRSKPENVTTIMKLLK